VRRPGGMPAEPEKVEFVEPLDDDSDDGEADASPVTHFGSNQKKRNMNVELRVDLTAVFLVYIVNFLDSLGGSISTPILPFYATEFHANYTQVGYLFSAFAMAQVCSMPLLSYLSDLRGRKIVLILATVGTGVGAFWQGTATSYYSLLASRVFSGLWSGVASVCQVYIVDVVPPELRADYMSYLNSSTQASTLFGPSIGAGLSALGINVPVLVQGVVSFVLALIIWAHLPESPEWCRLHAPESPFSPGGARTKIMKRATCQAGMGRKNVTAVIISYGALSLSGMVAQMAILSMFAVYAEQTYGLNSVEVGFTITLGALSSVGTNIWLSPPILKKMGSLKSSLLGFALTAVGALLIAVQPYWVSCVGLIIAYQGLAINSSAVATGAANLTDQPNRATIMTGTRMFKSAGAVIGPIVSGPLASQDVRYPFFAAAAFSVMGMSTQVLSMPMLGKIMEIVHKRKVIDSETPFIDGEWIDEYGTAEEIRDLGEFVADLLSQRHYRWITYNGELKHFLQDSFPEVSNDSLEEHKADYNRRRQQARDQSDVNLAKKMERLEDENKEMREQVKKLTWRHGGHLDGVMVSKKQERQANEQSRKQNLQHLVQPISGFGGN